jgi:hypothetical protein
MRRRKSFVLSSFSVGTLDSKWIGFTDRSIEGEWRWIDSTPGVWQDPDNFANPVQTAHTNWRSASAEPNNAFNEDFAVYSFAGEWNDQPDSSGSFSGYVVEFEAVREPGDFNDDRTVDAVDIDLLCSAIHVGAPKSPYDVNGDGLVTLADLTYEVETILSTSFGDTDTDGDVDLADLGNLASGFEQTGETRWGLGNFNCDDDVDLNDLGTLATNFEEGRDVVLAAYEALVPEPGCALISGLVPAIFWRRRG